MRKKRSYTLWTVTIESMQWSIEKYVWPLISITIFRSSFGYRWFLRKLRGWRFWWMERNKAFSTPLLGKRFMGTITGWKKYRARMDGQRAGKLVGRRETQIIRRAQTWAETENWQPSCNAIKSSPLLLKMKWSIILLVAMTFIWRMMIMQGHG